MRISHSEPPVSPEQIARAKEVAILDYLLAYEPNNLTRSGNEYRLRDHDSFTISNGMWHWHSRGFGCKTATALNYLIEVRGYSFVDAVQHLVGDTVRNYTQYTKPAPSPVKKETERLPFVMPPRNNNNDRVIEYLQSRGISKEMVLECIERGSLYESTKYHNCVFVGRDECGKARFASMRGTSSGFRRDADGSEKCYGFVLPPDFAKPNHSMYSRNLMVFESPIDALSHKVLHPNLNGWRLSLGCTALPAMTHFLDTNPNIGRIIACTDNDSAGNLAAEKIREIAEELGLKYRRDLPECGNDWNENLQSNRNEVTPLEDVRKDILFLEEPFKYPEAFRIKDGDSVKVTFSYDGSEDVKKCRWIDETHLYLGNNTYHISELAERMMKNSNKIEPIPDQKRHLDIIAAKYGDPLQDVEISMTKAAIRKLVGGDYELTPLTYTNGNVYAMRADGPDGVAICGIVDETLTSLHPYNAQSCKRDFSPADHPTREPPAKKHSLLGQLNDAKTAVAEKKAESAAVDKPKKRSEPGIG